MVAAVRHVTELVDVADGGRPPRVGAGGARRDCGGCSARWCARRSHGVVPAAAALFGLVRRLGGGAGATAGAVRIVPRPRSDEANQHASSAACRCHAGCGRRAAVPGRRSASRCARRREAKASSAVPGQQAVWLRPSLQHVAVACRTARRRKAAAAARAASRARLSATSGSRLRASAAPSAAGTVVKMELAMNDAMNDAINDAMMECVCVRGRRRRRRGIFPRGGRADGHRRRGEFERRDRRSMPPPTSRIGATRVPRASIAVHVCFYRQLSPSSTGTTSYTGGLTESEGCAASASRCATRASMSPYRAAADAIFCHRRRARDARRSCSALAPRARPPERRRRLAGLADLGRTCSAPPPSPPPRRRRPRRAVADAERPWTDTSGGICLSEAQRAELLAVLGEGGAGGFVASLYATYAWRCVNCKRRRRARRPPTRRIAFSTSKAASVRSARSSSRGRPCAPSSFDVHPIKSEVAHHRELRTLLGTGVVARQLIAALARVAHRDRRRREDPRVGFARAQLDVPCAAAAPVERGSLRATAKPSVGFEVRQLNFNPADETQLLVSGLKECVADHARRARRIGPRKRSI